MKVRALTQFSTERDVVHVGDVVEMQDWVAEVRIEAGLVERVGDAVSHAVTHGAAEDLPAEVETADDVRPVETAVSRPRKGKR
jgi:hypothetical protein